MGKRQGIRKLSCIVNASYFCGGRIMLIFFFLCMFSAFQKCSPFNLPFKIKDLFFFPLQALCLHPVVTGFLSYYDHLALMCFSPWILKSRAVFELMIEYPVSIYTTLFYMYLTTFYLKSFLSQFHSIFLCLWHLILFF